MVVFLVLPVLALALVEGARSVDAGCKARCRSTIKACYKVFCDPPDHDIPVRARRLGIKAGVFEGCERLGVAEGCPKRRYPAQNTGPLDLAPARCPHAVRSLR